MRFILFLMLMMVANVASAIDCQTPPSCTELGYAAENDPSCAANGYVYCPFDENYKKCVDHDCEALGFTESDKTSWCGKIVKCKDNEKFTACACAAPQPEPCVVGSVYYANGTCSSVENYQGCGTPVGVVYWVEDAEGKHGKVINLKDLGRENNNKTFDPANPYNKFIYFYWGDDNYDFEGLENYDSTNIVNKLKAYDPDLYDGQGNTDKILADSGPTSCSYKEGIYLYYQFCIPQAVQAAHDFYPYTELKDDERVGQGKWYLPALGELMELYGYDNSRITSYEGVTGRKGDNKILVNNTLEALKNKDVVAEKLTDSYYWSSSEYNSLKSWILYMNDGNRYYNPKSNYTYVRASLEF